MKFKEFMDLGIKMDDGVLITKYLMNISLANSDSAKRIKSEFVNHGFELDVVPGEFIKIFTMNEKEIADLSKILIEIDELGLKDIFQNNLRPASFKRAVLERIKFCIANKFPYLNHDNTFISELYNPETFAEYTAHKPLNMIKTAQELNNSDNLEDVINNMDSEDRQVYNQIMESLSYLVLQHPTNENLTTVVNNIKVKIIDSLKRKEYHFLSIDDIVSNVMFEGIDVTPEMENIKELVLSAFPDDMQKQEGRGLA